MCEGVLGLSVYSVCATGFVFQSIFSVNVSYFSVYIECEGVTQGVIQGVSFNLFYLRGEAC